MKHAMMDILIIEDSLYDAELIIRALKKDNPDINVEILTDGEEAIEFIDNKIIKDNFIPRIIILDLKLPKLNGIEVLTHLKSKQETESIPVVVLSSSSQKSDVKACYELGANSYVLKPIDVDDFFDNLSTISSYWLQLNLTMIR